MDKLQLKATNRNLKTTKPAKLRKDGVLPAVLYGHKVQNQALAVNAREFDKVLKKAGESTIVDLVTEDGKNHPVLIHDVQIHYLTSVPTHVDFYEVSMTEKLKAKVVLEFTGEAPAVKTLPHNIPVSLDGLKTLQDTIHVKDLVVNAKVKVLNPSDEMIAKLQPPRDVEAELATPVVEDISKVEGAAEEKPVAEGAEAPAKPEKKEKEAK
jgi:large subunit ribosomal protein L25